MLNSSEIPIQMEYHIETEKILLWEQRINDYKNSKLKASEWCEIHQITQLSYYYWHKRIHQKNEPENYTPILTDVTPILRKPEQNIFWVCGTTDFRRQIKELATFVSMQLKMDPYENGCVFIFCNKRHNSIMIKTGLFLQQKHCCME